MKKRLRKHAGQYGSGLPINDVTARGLGWFSIGLGVTEVLMPRLLARAIGMSGSSGLLFLYGLREIATGVGILKAKDQTPWLWGRVAGDALDLATLAAHAGPNNKLNIGLGMAAVAGVTALDFTIASAMSERDERRSRSWVDYSDRSGFNGSPDEVRGIARGELRTPPELTVSIPAEREPALHAIE